MRSLASTPLLGLLLLAAPAICAPGKIGRLDGDLAAGPHRASFDGAGVASGIYFAVLRAPGMDETRRLALLR